jgi:glycosyltransferase involved in cell wall biosynthesis
MPCYNRAHDLIRALRAYDQQHTREPFELIAVDDGSSDATYDVLASYQPSHYQLRIERQEKNQGPAAARNRGLAQATAPLVLFVGDDILPDRDFVRAHLTAHRCNPDPKVAILGKVIWGQDLPINTLMTHIDGLGAQQFSYHYLQDGQIYDFRHLYTANISLKTSFLKSVDKWFDTDFQYAAFEDIELSYRLSQQGLRILYSRSPLGYHYHYHNIWTFSTRQYRAGLMACVVIRKHPALGEIIKGKNWQKSVWLWKLASAWRHYPPNHLTWLEAQTLRIGNAYEWQEHRLLDTFYLQALNYFLVKGIIDGTYQDPIQAAPLHHAHAQQTLAPLLTTFLQENLSMDERHRAAYDHNLEKRLAAFADPISNLMVKTRGNRMLAARKRKPAS